MKLNFINSFQLAPIIKGSLSLRVYGILINNNKQVLVSDELIKGDYFTKFPGGGLELGEGTRDCLQREFKEETNLDVVVGEHIYTTDFFQLSAFKANCQIISIYYFVHATELSNLKISNIIFDFTEAQKADKTAQFESFRFVEWENFNEASVSLPIDKVLVKILKKKYLSPKSQQGFL